MVKKSATENFHIPDRPSYRASHASGEHRGGGEFKVLSWNIKFSRKIEAAIHELENRPELGDAGIMLLQEMDEKGVESIARALKYNYVYYPASVHHRTSRKFGNAVLARWPIVDSGKLPLPHPSPRTGQIRIAARVVVNIDGRRLLVYSVHTETFALDFTSRQEQFQALAEDVQHEEYDQVLVGGDFNTIKKKDIKALDRCFAAAGLKRVSSGIGPTLKAGFMEFSLDHIFARGLNAGGGGAWKGTSASDHYPVWQFLSFDTEEQES
ncbi:MAG: endonuclease/exonuclease/phosphatase family protein [Thermoleophilia bacterium]|jgi:endonuclease/exonuclease/phosphatase family metal-dependent hydrolase